MSATSSQIKSHRDLVVWQKALDLAEAVYLMSKAFPREEMYELTSQVRRAAVSIPANIAEGQGRRSKAEFRQFLGHARGSLYELDTHIELALRLGYLKGEVHSQLTEQTDRVGRLMNGLLRSLSQ